MRNHLSIASFGAAALALTLGGCGNSTQSSGASNPDSVKQAIKADEAKWNQQIKAKDTEGLASHYTDDAYFVGPGAPPSDGSTAIRQFYANGLTDPAIDVNIASDKIDVAGSGDMAYSRGHFTEKYTDKKTGKIMTDNGSYLSVYKKQSDGSWKMVEDFATTDPDSAKPVQPGKPATHAKMVQGL
jgi:uncharacterized protein (TIGR02246 family)